MASKNSNSILKGRWTMWILSIVFALLAGFGVLMIVLSAAEQVTYYATATAIPANTLLTAEQIKTVTTSANGVPETALSLSQLQSQPLYTKIALKAGEPLTGSNVGPLTPFFTGVPADYVAASLAITPDNAAGGRITQGDYVDIAAIYDGGGGAALSKVILHNVLVLDVAVSPDTIANNATKSRTQGANTDTNTGPDSQTNRNGIPELYTFAVSPADFSTLALIRDNNPYLALSQGNPGELDASTAEDELFTPGIVGAPVTPDPTATETPAPDASGTPAPSGSSTPAPTGSSSPAASATPSGITSPAPSTAKPSTSTSAAPSSAKPSTTP